MASFLPLLCLLSLALSASSFPMHEDESIQLCGDSLIKYFIHTSSPQQCEAWRAVYSPLPWDELYTMAKTGISKFCCHQPCSNRVAFSVNCHNYKKEREGYEY